MADGTQISNTILQSVQILACGVRLTVLNLLEASEKINCRVSDQIMAFFSVFNDRLFFFFEIF